MKTLGRDENGYLPSTKKKAVVGEDRQPSWPFLLYWSTSTTPLFYWSTSTALFIVKTALYTLVIKIIGFIYTMSFKTGFFLLKERFIVNSHGDNVATKELNHV